MSREVLAFDRDRNEGVSARSITELAPANPQEHELGLRSQRLLAALDLNDSAIRQRIVLKLHAIRSFNRLWLLLTLLESGRSSAWEGPHRLEALERLVQADDAFMRNAAYRWLAALYQVDLRCEMAAKRALVAASKRENAFGKRRIAQLLRRC